MPSKKYTFEGAPQYGQTKVKSDTHPDILFKPNKKRAREILSDGIELEPRCMLEGTERRQQAAVTNRGHLIPCCNVDQPDTLADPRMVKMLKVSKLADVDRVEDILESKEWTEFADNLNNNIGLDVCYEICGETKQQKTETYINMPKYARTYINIYKYQ